MPTASVPFNISTSFSLVLGLGFKEEPLYGYARRATYKTPRGRVTLLHTKDYLNLTYVDVDAAVDKSVRVVFTREVEDHQSITGAELEQVAKDWMRDKVVTPVRPFPHTPDDAE